MDEFLEKNYESALFSDGSRWTGYKIKKAVSYEKLKTHILAENENAKIEMIDEKNPEALKYKRVKTVYSKDDTWLIGIWNVRSVLQGIEKSENGIMLVFLVFFVTRGRTFYKFEKIKLEDILKTYGYDMILIEKIEYVADDLILPKIMAYDKLDFEEIEKECAEAKENE